MDEKLLELGTVAILFLFAMKEFFAYLKVKKSGGGDNNGLGKAILDELQTMNSNHLHTIQKCVEDGNSRLIGTIHQDNTKIIELLGEIKGVLSAKK